MAITQGVPAPPTAVERVSPWRQAGEIVLLCCAVAFVAAAWSGLLLVVAGGIVSLPLLALLSAGAVLLMRRPRGVGRTVARELRVWVSGLVIVLEGLAWGADAFDDVTYLVLPEVSQHGCRAVVQERSFLARGAGSLHLLHGGTGFAHQVASFSTDDPRPFTDGSAEVTWDGDQASVAGSVSLLTPSGSQIISC